MKDLRRTYEADGVIAIENAFSASCMEAVNNGISGMTDGTNRAFAKAFAEAYKAGTPDFTSGQKIPWLQYEANTVLQGLEDIDGAPVSTALASKVRKIMSFVPYDEAIKAVATDENLLFTVASLLDCGVDELDLFQEMALLKPSGGGREKPWHQDAAYFNLGLDAKVVGCWIAVDAATIDNGCMRFQRGGHTQGALPHFAVRDFQICDAQAPSASNGDDIVAVPLPPGGLLLFDGKTPHGTPTNASPSRRRALQFHWVRRNTPRVDPHAEGGRIEHFGGTARGLQC